MKYKYLLFCTLVSIFFLAIVSSSLQAKNQRENDCLDGFTNPSEAERVECKARGKLFTADPEPRLNIVPPPTNDHTPVLPGSSLLKTPQEVYEDLLGQTAVHARDPAGAGTITFKATGTDYERIEVWGPTGNNLTGSKTLWCTIDMTPENNRENWYKTPYECIDSPWVAQWNNGTTGPHYHVYVTRATVYMRRTPNILWRCTAWFFGCTGGEHYPGNWWGETVEYPWALGKGNILKSGTTHHTWTF